MILKSTLGLFLVLLSLLIACNTEFPPGEFSMEQIDKFREEFKLPAVNSYVLDSSYLPDLLSLNGSVDSETIKNHYQPLQAMYFDQKGQLVSFHVNCYTGIGVEDKKSLNWNPKNAFESFVPKTVAPLDTLFRLSDLAKYIHNLDGKTIDIADFSKKQYFVVVFWAKSILENDARALINLVQGNARAGDANIIYVNTDNMLR